MKDMLGSIVRKVVQLPVAMLTVLFDLVEKLSGEFGQQWLAELKKFLRKENCWVGVEAKKTILKLISGNDELTIDATDGTEVLADANDVFGWIDGNFKNWGADEAGVATEETAIDIYEMEQDVNFAQIAASVSFDVKRLCLTQAQIKGFAKKHRKWLLKDGYATFFFFKSHGQFFVADVGVDSCGVLGCLVFRFDRSGVWRAICRRRMVVPRLA